MLLHLRDLLDLQSSPTVLPSLLAHHVETGRAHHKKTNARTIAITHSTTIFILRLFSYIIFSYGGPGENRTPVHSAFNLKELQQFFTDYLYNNLLILLKHILKLLQIINLKQPF